MQLLKKKSAFAAAGQITGLQAVPLSLSLSFFCSIPFSLCFFHSLCLEGNEMRLPFIKLQLHTGNCRNKWSTECSFNWTGGHTHNTHSHTNTQITLTHIKVHTHTETSLLLAVGRLLNGFKCVFYNNLHNLMIASSAERDRQRDRQTGMC